MGRCCGALISRIGGGKMRGNFQHGRAGSTRRRNRVLMGCVFAGGTLLAIDRFAAAAGITYTFDPLNAGTMGSDGAGTWDSVTSDWSVAAADTTYSSGEQTTGTFTT